MDLFIDSQLDFEKVSAAEVTLPEDPNQWQNEVLQELYKQHPYVADFSPDVVMDRIDAERAFGFGHVEIGNKTEIQSGPGSAGEQVGGIHHVRIPIIIREGKMKPFDTLVTEDSKMLPLNEKRLRLALFRPQMFDVTSRTPGDQSIISTLYPPYRQNNGFGGGGSTVSAGMGKEGSAAWQRALKSGVVKAEDFGEMAARKASKGGPPGHTAENVARTMRDGSATTQKGTVHLYGRHPEDAVDAAVNSNASLKKKHAGWGILGSILPSIHATDFDRFIGQVSSPLMKAAYVANKNATQPALNSLSGYEPSNPREKMASYAAGIKPSVIQINKTAGGYCVKTASHLAWAPVEKMVDRGQLVGIVGPEMALAIDKTGGATMGDVEVSADDPEGDHPELIKDFGIYKVQDEKGAHIIGYVFPNLIDVTGASVPLALFTNGSQTALQGEIVGVHAGTGANFMTGHPRGYGTFVETLPNGRLQAMVPMHVKAALKGESRGDRGVGLMAELMDGTTVEILQQPGVRKVTQVDEGTLIVPENFEWMPLDETEQVSLASHPEEFSKEAAAHSILAEVVVRGSDAGVFSIDGASLSKVASSEKSMVNLDQALFVLAGLGVAPSYAMAKLGQSISEGRPVSVKVARAIQSYEDRMQDARASFSKVAARTPVRHDLTKEAAVIPDPMAVDAVLSLGFLNPENLMAFVSYLPALNEAQEHLCELLIASRMGVREIPEYAVERCIRSLEETIDGLKMIAFQQN